MTEREPYVKPALIRLRTRWPDMGPEELPATVSGTPAPPIQPCSSD